MSRSETPRADSAEGRANPHLPQLIRELLDSDAYPHHPAPVELIETHISWVFLAGNFVYKVKKPVALGFLDFRKLEQRRFYCEEEIRLNRRFAPEIYIDVVKITLQNGRPQLEGQGTAIEYAVKMHRFDEALRLDKQLESGLLRAEDMRELGANIAARHEAADIVPISQRQHVLELTETQMHDNFTALRSRIDDGLLSPLYEWTQQALHRLRPAISQRFDQGFFRDCHGDLHLANLVRLPSGITTFDCIEFSADLRNIDVACDIAFLVMDLESKRRADLAAHFINRYFERTDDYDSMRLFDLYFVYRCLVRAKVDAIRASERSDDGARLEDLDEARRYCNMATRQTVKRRPLLISMHGLSGSGKTWISERLMAALPAIRIRSDLLRKRLFGLAESQKSESGVGEGIYVSSADDEVYAGMRRRAEPVLGERHNVILDATFLHRGQRAQATQLALDCGAELIFVRATAPQEELQRRIRARQQGGADASEASLAVLEHQLKSVEAMTDFEQSRSITVDSRDSAAVALLADQVRERAGGVTRL